MSSFALPLALAEALRPSESACPVVGAPRYWVTDHGRVLSVVNGVRVLRPCPNASGYLCVELQRGPDRDPALRSRWSRYIHELVALAFIGPRPTTHGVAYQIDHVTGDKTDNRRANLHYVTRSRNVQLAIAAGLHSTAKLSAVAVWTLRCRAHVDGEDAVIRRATQKYGVTIRAVRNALAGRTWAVVPDPASRPTASELAQALMLSTDEACLLLRLSPFGEGYVPVERVTRIIPLQPPTDRQAA